MMDAEEQEVLTRVGPGTTMGELLRRYWFPVAASSELPAGTTRAVRLLGEDLVLFRMTNGELGLVTERCPHRGASLRCGRVDDEGIACPYHGWKFDRQGQCLRMPAEAVQKPRLLERAATRAYLADELGGLVFAYIGPMPAPLLPRYDLFMADNVLRDIGWAMIPCNWLQIMENSVDPAHVEWLHGHNMAAARMDQGKSVPTHYARRHTKIGFDLFHHGIVKRRVLEGGSEADDDWSVGHPLIFPCMLRVGTQGQHRFQIRVPVDDTHTLHFWYSCYRPLKGGSAPTQTDIPLYEVPWRDAKGNYITDFVDGGDIMVWVTQGPIADRTHELLVGSDQGIVMYRKLLLDQARIVNEGGDPMGVIRDFEENRLIAFAQEANKFGAGEAFLREAIEMSHVRYSPIKQQIIDLLDND
jgi:5,5'-dehydrodivanillate O-demethylase